MVFKLHARLLGIKDEHQLVSNMHWNAKRLMGQSVVVRNFLKNFKSTVKEYKDLSKKEGKKAAEAQTKKGKLLKRLEATLGEIERLFFVEEKEEGMISIYGAREEQAILEHTREITEEANRLVATRQIPSTYGKEIREEVMGQFAKIKEDIKGEAEVALVIRRGGIPFKMAFKKACLVIKSGRAISKREKRRIHSAENVLKEIEELKSRIEGEKKIHEIDKIKHDLIEEADEYAKAVHFIASDISFCLMFMDAIKKDFKELKKEIKKIGKPVRLVAIQKRIGEEWQVLMNDISKVLQQLRFSVAPGEIKAAT